jgi:hypothetical protein
VRVTFTQRRTPGSTDEWNVLSGRQAACSYSRNPLRTCWRLQTKQSQNAERMLTLTRYKTCREQDCGDATGYGPATLHSPCVSKDQVEQPSKCTLPESDSGLLMWSRDMPRRLKRRILTREHSQVFEKESWEGWLVHQLGDGHSERGEGG